MSGDSVATQTEPPAASAAGIPEERRLAAREYLSQIGSNPERWARTHGYSAKTVRKVLAGNLKAHWGISHNIAVRLGMKDGDIVAEFEPAIAHG
jgi:gp16 family phage-associated protein